jgi:hypothetical protein
MPTFLTPLHEFNGCHNPSGAGGGRFCSGDSGSGSEVWEPDTPFAKEIARVRKKYEEEERVKAAAAPPPDNPDYEYTIVKGGYGADEELPVLASGRFTEEEYQKGLHAPLILRPGGDASARLGTPGRWTAPNGVVVAYARNNADAPPVGFHQMETYNEMAVPLTTDTDQARGALRAWAKVHLQPKVTTRWQARQLVRPGD